MAEGQAFIRSTEWNSFCLRKNISWTTYVLICLFGLGSWVAVNGLWVELPVLVGHAPEQWSLPSYLTVIIQLANIGPVIYALGNRFAPHIVHEKTTILFIVAIGCVACALLGLYWDETSSIGGKQHSTVLFILSFLLALVDCTSSLVFLTFMSTFPSTYMSALFVGETSSGLLPSLVALAQGIENGGTNSSKNTTDHKTHLIPQSRFSPEGFFFFLFTIMVICGIAFLALNYLPVAKRQHVRQKQIKTRRNSNSSTQPLFDDTTRSRFQSTSTSDSSPQDSYLSHQSVNSDTFSWCERHILLLLCIQTWINCLSNGVLPSIQAYASIPYGNKTYHLVATLSNIASALTCFIALWFPSTSSRLVTVLASVYTVLSTYIIVLAAMSPTPPMHGTSVGSLIVIFVSIVSGILISYTKLTISTIMRDHGKRALFWCGICIQIGSCIGALVMFPLVNIAKLFHQ